MLNQISPALAAVCLGIAVLSLSVYAYLFCMSVRCAAPYHALLLISDLLSLCFFIIWGLILALATAGLTFDPITSLILRWSTVLVTFVSMFLAFQEHEWIPLLPGLCALLSLPFFESAFDDAFPYVLLALLAAYLAAGLFRFFRSIRGQRLTLRSVQEAVDTIEDGLLFAEENGTVLLCNQAMRALCAAIGHRDPTDAAALWAALADTVSTDRITKVESDGNYLFRFTAGNTWTFHRETIQAGEQRYLQIVALNVTESDEIQRQITVVRTELDNSALQLRQIESTIEKLREEEARVRNGRIAFDTITEKMAVLYRFFADHYALPADTFDYKKLAELTAGLLQELQRVPVLHPEEGIALTVDALRLLGVEVRQSGSLPGLERADTALVSIIREAAVNAMIHGAATSISITMEAADHSFLCTIENNGVPPSGTLTPGGGLMLMRRLLFPLGGTLEISKSPRFTLTVRIPTPLS
ncbi:MAG: hypothetical protein VB055_02505 [Oscillospiraceae bacterium]|nr:hypothetical protein [Oscillospiraceae bacterium]